jgi:uncharacterized repeat protein (TIGR01451 family)
VGGPQNAGPAFVFEEGIFASADLWIRKTDGRAAAMPGQGVTYTVTVGNDGPDPAIGARVRDMLPATLTCTTTCAGAGGATCAPGPLVGSLDDVVSVPVGGVATYTMSCLIASDATGSLSNTATVAPPLATVDPDPEDNTSTDTDTLDPAADLSVLMTHWPDPVSPGGALAYWITVTNEGPWPATGVTLTQVLPPGTTFVSSIPGSGVCEASSGTLECALGTLGASESRWVSVEVAVEAGARGVLSSTASVQGSPLDPVASNDSATETVLVSMPTSFYSIAPCRVVDTRVPGAPPLDGPLMARTPRLLPIAGQCDIPATATSVSLNVTVTGPEATGNLRLYPAGLSLPSVSIVSYRPGQTRGGSALVALSADGKVEAYAAQAEGTTVHVIIDVTGYFE